MRNFDFDDSATSHSVSDSTYTDKSMHKNMWTIIDAEFRTFYDKNTCETELANGLNGLITCNS